MRNRRCRRRRIRLHCKMLKNRVQTSIVCTRFFIGKRHTSENGLEAGRGAEEAKELFTDLYTERLHLRKMTTADSSSLFRIWSDPDVAKYMNIDRFTNENQAKDMIAYLDQLAQNRKAFRFTIVELKSRERIGSCGYNTLDFGNAKTEIGYEIAKSRWGKGYAPGSDHRVDRLCVRFSELQSNRSESSA